MGLPNQTLLPGLPPPKPPTQDGSPDPLDRAEAALDRLADIHRRMDELEGKP